MSIFLSIIQKQKGTFPRMFPFAKFRLSLHAADSAADIIRQSQNICRFNQQIIALDPMLERAGCRSKLNRFLIFRNFCFQKTVKQRRRKSVTGTKRIDNAFQRIPPGTANSVPIPQHSLHGQSVF